MKVEFSSSQGRIIKEVLKTGDKTVWVRMTKIIKEKNKEPYEIVKAVKRHIIKHNVKFMPIEVGEKVLDNLTNEIVTIEKIIDADPEIIPSYIVSSNYLEGQRFAWEIKREYE